MVTDELGTGSVDTTGHRLPTPGLCKAEASQVPPSPRGGYGDGMVKGLHAHLLTDADSLVRRSSTGKGHSHVSLGVPSAGEHQVPPVSPFGVADAYTSIFP